MTLQDIIQSLDELSTEEQVSLLDVLWQRLKRIAIDAQKQSGLNSGDSFWQGVLQFRETIEKEGLKF